MLMLARLHRPLAVLPLLAALASAAPPVRWCPVPWSAVSVECFVACETRAPRDPRACAAESGAMRCAVEPAAASCAGEPDTSPCGASCTGEGAPSPVRDAAPDGPRAFCLDALPTATQGPGAVEIGPPGALAAIAPDAAELSEPACVAARPIAFEPARPRARPPGLPPPVRGPPCVA